MSPAAERYEPWVGGPWEPRDWQRAALPAIVHACKAGQAGLVSAVMGSGKSILIAELVAMALGKLGDNVIIVSAPSRKLVRQLGATIATRCGDVVGYYFTDRKQPNSKVIVTCNASVPAVVSWLRYEGKRVALWVADEAHGTEAQKIKACLPLMRPAARVGFTATPYRASHQERLDLWDVIVYRYTLGDALRDGVLVPWAVELWDGQHEAAEDVDAIVLRMIRESCEGPGIVSAVSIHDATEYAAVLTTSGIKAEAIHSKQTRRQQDDKLAKLKAGELGALVHVALLAEGVDLPWLRWIALRRPVKSRVRLFQEFGRVLRVYPGKVEAVVVDPHDLLSAIGLQHPATLSDTELAEKLEPIPRAPWLDELPSPGRAIPPAIAVSTAGKWVRAMVAVLEAHGKYTRGRLDHLSQNWRSDPATHKQQRELCRLARCVEVLPEEHAEAITQITAHREGITKGLARDLITVLRAAQQCARDEPGWSWPESPRVPELPMRVQLALPVRVPS